MSADKENTPASRLKNLDSLFGLGGAVENTAKTQRPPVNAPPKVKRQLAGFSQNIALDELNPFAGHPFREYEGERLDDMVESICAHGVLVPVIARRIDSGMEILAGHNRVKAAKLAGLATIPAVILENVPDEEAWLYVIETNLMQRSFTDMAHSEKAAVIAVQYSKLFSPGKRTDILNELTKLEKPHETKDKRTSSQLGGRFRSDKLVADAYSLSKNTVARYLRINKLSPALKKRLDSGGIPFVSAVTISFLKPGEQDMLEECLTESGLSVTLKSSDLLREYSAKGALAREDIIPILKGEIGRRAKPNRMPAIKISNTVYAKYFKPGQPVKEVQEIVRKALELYFKK